jgi:hypothetical protein
MTVRKAGEDSVAVVEDAVVVVEADSEVVVDEEMDFVEVEVVAEEGAALTEGMRSESVNVRVLAITTYKGLAGG